MRAASQEFTIVSTYVKWDAQYVYTQPVYYILIKAYNSRFPFGLLKHVWEN